MAKIPLSKLRKDLDRHRKAVDQQIDAGKKKLAKAVSQKDKQEAARIRAELSARRQARQALNSMRKMAAKTCCDPFQNCPDI